MLVAIAIACVLGVAYNLDRPWIKARVVALVRSNAGIEIDYQATRFRLRSGLEIDDLVVLTPPELRGAAPELVRVAKIEAAWTTALFTGAGRRVDRVVLSGVALTIVVDKSGRTSFDGLGKPNAKPSPKTPLSEHARDLIALAPSLPAGADVSGLSVNVVRTIEKEHADVVERTSFRGLDASVRAEAASDGWHLRARVGSPGAPLELDVARALGGAPAGDAHAKLCLTADVTAHDASAALDVDVTKQTFDPALDPKHLLHAEAHVHFDPDAKKTTIMIDPGTLAGGIATASAAIELPDEGAPLLRHSEGDVDLTALLALLPPDLVPVHAALSRGRMRYRVESLALDQLPRLSEGASVAIDADLADVKVTAASLPGGVAVPSAKLSARVEPAADASLRGRATLTLDSGRLGLGGDAVLLKNVALDVDATQAKGGALTGTFALAFAAIEKTGAAQIVAKEGKVELRAADLLLDPRAPLTTRGDLTLKSELPSVEIRSQASRARFERVALSAHSKPAGQLPWALDADVRSAAFRLIDGAGRVLANAPLHVESHIADLYPDAEAPGASRAKARVVADAGDLHIEADATKASDAFDYDLDVRAKTLEALRPLLPSDAAAKVPLERMAASLTSKGRVDGIRAPNPALRQHAELRVERPAVPGVTASALALSLDSNGTELHQELDGGLRLEELAIGGTSPSDDRVALRATIDRRAPSLDLHVDASGRAEAKLAATLGFDPDRRAVTYTVDGSVARLGALAALAPVIRGLSQVDLSRLEGRVTARGALLGVVSGIDRDGSVHLEEAPLRTAALDGTVAMTAKHVGWSAGATSVATPSIALDATLHGGGGRRTIEGHLDAAELRLASGAHVFEVVGLGDRFSATIDGDLEEPELVSTQTVRVETLKQDIQPMYRVGDATMSLDVRRGRDGVVHVANLAIANGAGGTSIALKGAIDPSEYQHRLSLRGELHQDLARLSSVPERFAARGTADVTLRVESPDLSLFRTVADVRVEGADVRVPAAGVVVEGVDGEVPITVSVRVGPRGIRMMREDQDNPYSALRFADQHPLLSRSSFISIRRLVTPQVSISPLVGNFQIEQNILSLRQFELGIRGGRVTGQCALDWNGDKSTLDMHVRADGVRSSHGEPFTGSAALVVSAGEHSIEGRADILQIGKRHLLDLFDFQDPFHADPAINKIRSALSFGYPDRVRVTFNHGFASAHVTLGGFAKLVSIGDLRGIPIGPLIDRFIPPFLPSKDEP